MKIILLLLLLSVPLSHGSYAQTETFYPDQNTQYLDESGKKIDAKTFNNQVATGAYTATPKISNKRIESMQLEKKQKDSKQSQTGEASSETQGHPMLKPDENTRYKDEEGKVIDEAAFSRSMESGKYTFMPEIDGNKVLAVQLVKLEVAPPGVDEAAKDFQLTDMQGKKWNLKDLRGKAIVLNFWFTACLPCRREMPELNALADQYKADDKVVFLAVTYDDRKTVEKFLLKASFKFNIVTDQSALVQEYGIANFPTSLIIDAEGKVRASFVGYSDNIREKIQETLVKIRS